MSDTLQGTVPLIPTNSAGRAVLAKFFKAVSDPSRLTLLEFLLEGEHTGTECVALLGLAQSRVSAHLQCLVNCGFVVSRSAGRFTYYRVEDPKVKELIRLGVEISADHAAAVAACTRI